METGSRDNPGLLPLVSAFDYNLQDVIKNVKQEDRYLLKYFIEQWIKSSGLVNSFSFNLVLDVIHR